MWRRIVSLPRSHPLIFGCVLSSVKTGAADLVTQTQLEGKAFPYDIDWRRTAIFGCWGFGYLGGVQYFLYTFTFPRLFPSAVRFIQKPLLEKLQDRHGLLTLAKQVGLDQFVHHPFVLFPCFYVVKEMIEGGSVMNAFQKYKKNIQRDCMISWAVWIPAFTVNFSVCPLFLRVPFVAVVSFGFTMYFSFLRGAPEPSKDKHAINKVNIREGVGQGEERKVQMSKNQSYLEERFQSAARYIEENHELVLRGLSRQKTLELYGLFKRSTMGEAPRNAVDDINVSLKERAKMLAWEDTSSLTPNEARQKYIDLVLSLGWKG